MLQIIRFRTLGVLAAVLLLMSPPSARASITLYLDHAGWSGAVSGEVDVAIPDPAPNGFFFLGSGSASIVYDGVTFSTDATIGDGNFFNVGPLFSGLPAVLSSQQLQSGIANIRVTLPVPVAAVGFNFGTFEGVEVNFELSNGEFFGGPTPASGYNVPTFLGVTSDTPFNSILITAPDATVLNVGLVAYANAVPEPASLSMLGIGLAGVLSVRLMRRTGRVR